MKIRVICVGQNKDASTSEIIADFERKIRPLAQLEVIFVKEEKGSLPVHKVTLLEAGRIKTQLLKGGEVILLDVKGTSLSTEQGFDIFRRIKNFGSGKITFVVGGAYGLDVSLRLLATGVWKLSDFTLSHQIARVVLLEQIYRLLTLVHGIPYHK